MAVANFCAASAWVSGKGGVKSVANPTGEGGGAATKAGAIPVPTVAAKAWKAVSMGPEASSDSNALARAPASVAAAAATVVEAGTTPDAYASTASAQA